MLSCSFLVRAPTLLQARVLENVEKPIYHSQPEVTEASRNMKEQRLQAFTKLLGCCSLLL